MKRIAAALSLVLVVTGCAALFNGKQTNVQMNSNPVGAEVLVNGNRVGTTPMAVQLSNKNEQNVTFRLAGHSDVTCMLNRKIGAGWIVLDVLAGVVPVIIDAATGSWYDLSADACNVTLSPVSFEAYAAPQR